MTPARGAAHLPTLTEVVPPEALPEPVAAAEVVEATLAPPDREDRPAQEAPQTQAAQLARRALADRVLAEVQREVDVLLEQRLREALTPALARAHDALLRELRRDIEVTLRDIVVHALSREASRHREGDLPR